MPDISRFAIVLPDGFVRIPVDDRIDERMAPELRAEVGHILRTTVRQTVESAQRSGASDFILAVDTIAGAPFPGTVVVARMPQPANDTRSVPTMIASMSAAPGVTTIDVDGLPGIRRTRQIAGTESLPAHRSINYHVWVPWEEQWIMFTATIAWTDDPAVQESLEAVEILLDTMVSTVRIERPEGQR